MAIEDLTNQLKQLKEHGEADLQLSPFMRDQYLAAVSDFRGALKTQRDKIVGLKGLGDPGGYASAQETKRRLVLNVVDTDGILATLDKYIAYLDEFTATVNAACKRLHGEDANTGQTVTA